MSSNKTQDIVNKNSDQAKENRQQQKTNAYPLKPNAYKLIGVPAAYHPKSIAPASGCKSTWLCYCPCHTDDSPSLSISLTPDDKVLWKCFAGCDQETIKQQLITDGAITGNRGQATGDSSNAYSLATNPCSVFTVIENPNPKALKAKKPKNLLESNIIAKYEYKDFNGDHFNTKLRYVQRWSDPESGDITTKKTFTWQRKKAPHETSFDYPLYNEHLLGNRQQATGSRLKDLSPSLYSLMPIICICEGEKDADTILTNLDLPAISLYTTDSDDAIRRFKWVIEKVLGNRGQATGGRQQGAALTPDNYSLMPTFIIFEDNDAAGRRLSTRFRHVLKELGVGLEKVHLVQFSDQEPKSDVTDFFESHGLEALKERVQGVIERNKQAVANRGEGTAVEDVEEIRISYNKDDKIEATYIQYEEKFKEWYPDAKKDIFSGDVMYFKKDIDVFTPVENEIDLICAKFRQLTQDPRHAFKYSSVDAKLFMFMWFDTMKPQFVVEIPDTEYQDLVDFSQRSKLFAIINSITIDESYGITQASYIQLMCEWHALIWQRLYDYTVQNKMVILHGSQGLGKDTFIGYMFRGLKQFYNPSFSVDGKDKDMKEVLCRTLVSNIDEFDKTFVKDPSTIKSLVTSEGSVFRDAYARRATLKINRCSLIASCNDDDMLRDETGNRRFMIFHVKEKKFLQFPTEEESLQILADSRWLYKVKFRASDLATQQNKTYIETHTPAKKEDILLAALSDIAQEWLSDCIAADGRELPYRPKIEVIDMEFINEVKRIVARGEIDHKLHGYIVMPASRFPDALLRAAKLTGIRSIAFARRLANKHVQDRRICSKVLGTIRAKLIPIIKEEIEDI